MKLAISQATTMPATFADDVSTFAAAGWTAMEVWLTKLETHLQVHSADDTRRLLDDKRIELVAAAYQGGLLLSQGPERKVHFDHYRSRLQMCQNLGIPLLILAADFSQAVQPSDIERAVVSLKQAAQWAAGFDIRVALEFRSGNSFCSSIETALLLTNYCDEPNVGVCLDVFHYYTGPSKLEDLELLSATSLAHVQVCDLAGVPRELAGDGDRVLPGDGDFRLPEIVAKLRKIGYDGVLSLEVLNPTLWQAPPAQLADLGLASLTRLVGA